VTVIVGVVVEFGGGDKSNGGEEDVDAVFSSRFNPD
jgi:hypothetical protein